MGAPLLIALSLAAGAQTAPPAEDAATGSSGAACADRWVLLDEAEAAVLEVDFDRARDQLGALEDSLSCGPMIERELLGQMWLLEGALWTFRGDLDDATQAWIAASRAAPGRWVEDLGVNLREDYEATLQIPERPASMQVEPKLPRGWITAVDGEVVELPVDIPAGLHVLQVGPGPDRIVFAKVLLALPDAPSVVMVELDPAVAALPPTPAAASARASAGGARSGGGSGAGVASAKADPVEGERAVEVERRRGSRPVRVWLGAGTGAAVGEALESGVLVEPAIKVVVPVELGVTWRAAGHWARIAATGAPLVEGSFLWSDGDTVYDLPLSAGGHVAGGLVADEVDLGLLAGASWPGRLPLAAVMGFAPGSGPVRMEVRLGANLATERAPEPAGSLVLALNP